MTDDEIERVARLAQAHEFVERLPQGYETVIGERGITLSGGQRQRIAIARALAVDPRILILDDATASVDATTEAQIRAGLREVMSGRTTLIIAHRLSTIALADEIVVLDERPDRRARHARRAARDEPRLPRDLRARPARAAVRRRGRGARRRGGGRLVRVHQAGGHLMRERGARGRRLVVEHDAAPARRPLAAHAGAYRTRTFLSVFSLLAATATALAPPLLAKYALDDAINDKTGTELVARRRRSSSSPRSRTGA